ncbi:MAG: VCBS repeat-containing protein [Rhodothermaceae bacterium]|nr:VCBS repeat-containing protein [Rhodothermaceae bacterium]
MITPQIRRQGIISFLVVVCTCFVCIDISAQLFTRVKDDPVVSDGRYSEGASWGDINNDGYEDVFVPHLHTELNNALYLNDGDGSFSQRVTGPIVSDSARSTGGSFGDFDNDGDLDLFVSNYYGLDNFLYFNNGDGTFSKVTEGSIVSDGGHAFGSSVVDYDNDGYLDIYVTNGAEIPDGENNFLYHNNGDGTFTRILTGPLVNDGKSSSAGSWVDYDNDGDQDLFVADGFTEDVSQANNSVYQNNGDGTFTEIDPVSIGIEHSQSSNGSWADYDNDGDFDLFITNFIGRNNNLYQNNGDGTFTRMAAGVLTSDGGDSVSSAWGDYDNDGDVDLYVTNDFNENNSLFRNNGDGSFTKLFQVQPSTEGGRSNGATWVDYDNDGFLDLFVPNGQRPATQSNILYRNSGSSGNNWINIKCTGTASNRSAVGTKIRAKAVINNEPVWQLRAVSGSTGFNAQNSFNVEIGLAKAAIVDSLVVEWPSGQIDIYTDIAAGGFYEATEGIGLNLTTTHFNKEAPVLPIIQSFQTYPNPFSSSAVISFDLEYPSHVKLDVYNLLGQRVAGLINAFSQAGPHKKTFDASGLPTGVYFYQLEVEEKIHTRKAVLVR